MYGVCAECIFRENRGIGEYQMKIVILPYCNLPESEKLYDREMAMQTLKLVKKLGFEIVRKNRI